jgi:hydroxyethylthiazole kinase-like uncharacterized protein yjeF
MIELLTTAEMGEADRLAVAGGVESFGLMERAGRAVADLIAARHMPPAQIVVVAGPGNNGGDGFVAAAILAEHDYTVRVLLLGDSARLSADAAKAAASWGGIPEPASPDGLASADVIIDALFGAGLDRPVEGPARAMIEAMNTSPAPVYAVDLPSGINGNSGAVMGCAITAQETVTFFRRKPGHLLLPGRLHCGRVSVADIGIPADVLERVRPPTFHNVPALWAVEFPVPRVDGHKYSRGHAVVVGGGMASTGAGRLAARGALRAGAGLVTIASPRAALAVNAATNLAIMVRPVDGRDALLGLLEDLRMNAVVIGPGGGTGPAMRQQALGVLATDRAVVLDADALTSLSGDGGAALMMACRERLDRPTVLTPHEGEFNRMFGRFDAVKDPRSSKLERARFVAGKASACIVLKGPDTVVASPDGRAAITDNAPPWLATAGTGDVLSGFVAGLLAQGMPSFEAACAAVWLHGEVGSEAGPGLIAEDLPEAVQKVYRRLFVELAAIKMPLST